MRRPCLFLACFAVGCFDPEPAMQSADSGNTTTVGPGTTSAPTTSGESTGVASLDGSTTSVEPGTTSDTGTPDTTSSSGSTGMPDPCAVDPCVNGTCVAEGETATCECEEGWAGDVCDGCAEGYQPVGDACELIPSCMPNPCGAGSCQMVGGVVECAQVFGMTGMGEPWMVPAGVTSLDVEALGASGGCAPLAGLGGEAIATVPVMGGDMMYVFVGGEGECGVAGMLSGGFNGGGDKFTTSGDFWEGGSGGGATDIRRGGLDVTDRVLVAGGGGGRGWGGQAGHGGGLMGETTTGVGGGCNPANEPICGGRGGDQMAGGIGGFCADGCNGLPGTLGQGGTSDGCAAAGGGGGGGYYGGGGGAHCSGGGGSSRVAFPGNSGTSTTTGVNLGDGSLTIVWQP